MCVWGGGGGRGRSRQSCSKQQSQEIRRHREDQCIEENEGGVEKSYHEGDFKEELEKWK